MCMVTLAAPVRAQTFEVAAGLLASPPASPTATPHGPGAGLAGSFGVALTGVRTGGTTLDASLGFTVGGVPGAWSTPRTAGSRSAAQLAVDLAANEVFGPLGNVIFELSGAIRTDALAQAALAVRGTIGPIAARLRLSAFGADAAVFDALATADDARPTLGRGGVGAELGVTVRFGRNVILDAEPDVYLTSAGVAGRIQVRLRRLRTFADNELRVYLLGATVPGTTPAIGAPPATGAWHVAVGAGVLLPRGRAPDVELLVFAGTRGAGVVPGARVSWAENFGGGVRLDATGSFEPYRVDVHPVRVAVGLELPLAADSTLRFDAVTAAFDRTRPAAFALRSSVSMPVELR